MVDERAYIHDGKYITLQLGKEKNDKDIVIGRLWISLNRVDGIECNNKDYEDKLRELAEYYRMYNFWTSYTEEI